MNPSININRLSSVENTKLVFMKMQENQRCCIGILKTVVNIPLDPFENARLNYVHMTTYLPFVIRIALPNVQILMNLNKKLALHFSSRST